MQNHLILVKQVKRAGLIRRVIIWKLMLLAPAALFCESLPQPAYHRAYPGIFAQIQRIARIEPELYSERVMFNLEEYLASEDPELKKAMNLVLAQKQAGLVDSVRIDVDGADADWNSVPFSVTDPAGDMSADILEQKVFLDAEENLYIMMRPSLKNGVIPAQFIFQPLVKPNKSSSFLKILCVNGKVRISDRSESGKDTVLEIEGLEFKADRVYELKVPIGAWLKTRGGVRELSVWTGYFDGQKYDAVSQAIPLLHTNHALLLLLDLLGGDFVQGHDPITAAIAYSNSTLYALGDEETRRQIREDQRKHFKLYQKVVAWQNARSVPFKLQELPAVPKILWAARYNRQAHLDLMHEAMRLLSRTRLTKDIYTEFIDRPEMLERVHNEIVVPHLNPSASIFSTARAIERMGSSLCETRFALWKYEDLYKRGMMRKEDYDRIMAEAKDTYEIEYMGRKRNWEEFRWNNYQFQNKCFRGMKILGDCGTYTQAMTALYRMAGISVIVNQRVNKEATFAYPSTHNFPAFYHPFLRRWSYVQVPLLSNADYRPYRPISLHVDLPVMNGLLYSDGHTAFGNESSSAAHIHFLSLGLGEEHLEKYFSDRGSNTALLDNASAPALLPPDTDADGLPDMLEKQAGTSAQNADTDMDGASDLYELHRGRDPLKQDAPGPAIDGLRADGEMTNPVSMEDAAMDMQLPAADIVRVHLSMRESNLHLIVETRGRPNADVIFQPLIAINNEKEWSIKALDVRGHQELSRREGEIRTPVQSAAFESERGSIYEMQIPIGDVRPGMRLRNLRIYVYLFSGNAHDSVIVDLLRDEAGSWITAPRTRAFEEPNAIRPAVPACMSPSEDSCAKP